MNLDFLYTYLNDFNKEDFKCKIKIYKDLLTKFNHIHNLTNFKNIDENILDSIEILKFFDFQKAKNIADIGSGAGFPAVFLTLLLKGHFHLFEPNPKKASFLRMVKIECALSNLSIYKEKVQNCKLDFKADIITSRALMDVKPLLEICTNLCDENTKFILYKGSEIYEELKGLEEYEIFENGFRKYCILKATKESL
ncbi:16S rRNA (guanine(527)-N(7))-methyltransferase RsmG [Campylobacter sp. US33a]|uniref:Ribosomal RNA small subunit methyltransferase G n=1 Tax=Campylobacter sp. CCS1377 TaxID=3158229 RepID=A0AAU7E5Q1_9BACT|nr:16S rRNA (guanine(527)-N(7))-methyltransferase RsmG [Campylobacter sp. US33a]MCW1361161.1 16S rRNA (guanine(527)-N(7))-methyltransferase RsmG [Campylobacter jejuni]TEY03563.1 16S rRNA (guanine(527)-N(7))-methyltransferase RsmG [Campylobacter sp. US33a]